MKKLCHESASASHYDKSAENYDALNEVHSQTINQTITNILNRYNVKSVLDFACGTGSQVYCLVDAGFDVLGIDINENMLNVAKQKKKNTNVIFKKGDMRTAKIGKFDAVITIFNAIGHLTKADFVKALRNIHDNLNENGLYIFDIFNLDYLLKDDHISSLTIDWVRKVGNRKIREIQYSTIDAEGVLASFTTSLSNEGERLAEEKSEQTLQVYSALDLKKLLQETGFDVLEQIAIDSSELLQFDSDRILNIARKRSYSG